VLGFLRVSTNARIVPKPITTQKAIGVVDAWLSLPIVRILHPGEDHWSILRDLLSETGSAGNLATDAHLAAIAIENGCELCSTDADFGRFRHLRWTNPIANP
jgi:toxin-antitoxin system PIN domain toxin